MKRFKHLVIGGIQNKMFNLILVTVLLLTGVYLAVSAYHNNMLTDLANESAEKQLASVEQIIGTVMDSVVEKSMSRTTALQAYLADEMFNSLRIRVETLGDYAGKLFSDPDAHPRVACASPDPDANGQVIAQLVLADGVDPADPALADRIGLAGNMSDLMISLFGMSEQTNSCFIALPDGAFLVTDNRSASKFDESGNPIPYDPRTRPWYQLATERGGLIFTDVETDAFTGDIGIVCAMPVYVNGQLAAVVGSDLFLNAMQTYVQTASENDSLLCVVNGNGHVVFSPVSQGLLQVLPKDTAQDLRSSGNAALSAFVTEALQGKTPMRLIDLEDGAYYAIGVPVESVGWALVSLCRQETALQPVQMLQQSQAGIQTEVSAAYLKGTSAARTNATLLLIGITLLMLIASLIMSRRIVKPLNTITKRISELDENNPVFKMDDTYRTGDEVQELAESFADISRKSIEYLDTVKRVTAEKERIGTELSLATQIQAAMLPHIVPAFPDRKDFDILGSMDPAKEVGGDFYDYFLTDDDHLCLLIADVSGKGVPAALFMMASKIILQSVAMLGGSPGEILTKTNEAICSNNEAEMFVTVWIGILELSTGKMTCANAGHEYPVFKRPDGNFELYKDRHGFVVGGMEGVKYKEYEIQLSPGSKLFLYTDGVPEATDKDLEAFGTERMIGALNENLDAAPIEVLKGVRKAVDGFVKDAEQFDDLTMLCLEYKGSEAKGGNAE